MEKIKTLKNFRGLFPVILFILSIIIISCGSDTTTSPNTPAGTILYSRDSISVWLQPSTSANGSDSLYFSTQNTGSFKVEFTLQADIDTLNSDTSSIPQSRGYWSHYTNSPPPSPVQDPVYGVVDHTETLQHNFVSGSTYYSLAVALSVTNSTRVHYIRLKNIKITKL